MERTRPLRRALLANALFSTATGLAMVLLPTQIAAATGLPGGIVLPVVGAQLLVWATFVGWLGTRHRPSTLLALGASAGDLGWVATTVVALAGWGHLLTPLGQAVTAIVALPVGAFGLLQLRGIRHIHTETDSALGTAWRHCVAVDVQATPARMWTILSDLGGIQAFVPELAHSEADGLAAPGVERRCRDHDGRAWRETTIAAEPGRALVLRFRAEDADFPFPVDRMIGGWTVDPHGAGSRVTVWWSYDPRPAWAALALVPLAAAGQDRAFQAVIGRMDAAARGVPADATRPVPRIAAVC